MRISDWSSDVCSSDLRAFLRVAAACRQQAKRAPDRGVRQGGSMARSPLETAREDVNTCPEVADEIKQTTCYMCACRCGINVYLKDGKIRYRSEERRAGNECVRPCRSRWAPSH